MRILLVSPRKSGTHLFQSMMAKDAPFQGKLEIGSIANGLYSLSNTFHTSFSEYFKSLDRNDFNGGKLLPIGSSLGIVTCRHPLDVLLSHIEFSFKNKNTAFSDLYFSSLRDKIKFVLNDNFYEDFFAEHFDYTAWSRLNNFITLSYEDANATITQISEDGKFEPIGSMKDFIKHTNIMITGDIYGKSATFNVGKIGRGFEFCKQNCPEVFDNKHYQKYCDFYGYSYDSVTPPKNLKTLNDKSIDLSDTRPKGQILLVQESFLDHRILYFNNQLYASPRHEDFLERVRSGKIDCFGKSLEEVKGMVCARIIWERMTAKTQSSTP